MEIGKEFQSIPALWLNDFTIQFDLGVVRYISFSLLALCSPKSLCDVNRFVLYTGLLPLIYRLVQMTLSILLLLLKDIHPSLDLMSAEGQYQVSFNFILIPSIRLNSNQGGVVQLSRGYKSDLNLDGIARPTLYRIARAERHFFLTCSMCFF